MALVACRECGAQVSNAAPTCPHCGIPNPGQAPKPVVKKRRWFWPVVIIVVILFAGYNALKDRYNQQDPYYHQTGTASGDTSGQYSAKPVDTSEAQSASTAPTSEAPKLDLTKPVFTDRGAIFCRYAMIFDQREGYGVDAIKAVFEKIINRESFAREKGCEVYKSGVRVYVNMDTEKSDSDVITVVFSPDDLDQITMKFELTNTPQP